MYTQAELVSPKDTNTTQAYDAIIIGAGLGGLLSAAQLLQRNKHILIVERLPHCGGRFTAKTFQGVQVSTGAVHMVPFGSSGVLSHMLQRLHVPHYFFDADVFGSFHVHGKQYSARGILGVFQFLGPRQFALLVSLGYRMFLRPLPASERALPYDVWLKGHIDVAKNPQLVAFFASIARFALSLELAQVSVAEVAAITKNMFRYGAPAIVRGGCGSLTQALEQHVLAQGGTILLSHEVLQILQADGRVTGIHLRDKANGHEATYTAPILVSDIGPRATEGLLHNHKVTQTEVLKHQHAGDISQPPIHEAIGLKIHILSDVSLIPHKGIMYCLDTQRIAGMVASICSLAIRLFRATISRRSVDWLLPIYAFCLVRPLISTAAF